MSFLCGGKKKPVKKYILKFKSGQQMLRIFRPSLKSQLINRNRKSPPKLKYSPKNNHLNNKSHLIKLIIKSRISQRKPIQHLLLVK